MGTHWVLRTVYFKKSLESSGFGLASSSFPEPICWSRFAVHFQTVVECLPCGSANNSLLPAPPTPAHPRCPWQMTPRALKWPGSLTNEETCAISNINAVPGIRSKGCSHEPFVASKPDTSRFPRVER